MLTIKVLFYYRALSFIEQYITVNVLPVYANTHSGTSHCSRQTTYYREEARYREKIRIHKSHANISIVASNGLRNLILFSLIYITRSLISFVVVVVVVVIIVVIVIFRDIIRNAVNASSEDCVLFVGSGCTGAVHKLIGAMDLKMSSKQLVR